MQHFTCNIQRKTAKREKGRERGRGGGGYIHLGHCPSWRGRAGGCVWETGGGGGENQKRDRDRHTERDGEREGQTDTERWASDTIHNRYTDYIRHNLKRKEETKEKNGTKKAGGGGGGQLRILFQFPLLYWTFVTYYMDTMTVISWR